MLENLFFAVLVMVSIPMTEEGAEQCVDLNPAAGPGQYHIRMTASNAGDEESVLGTPLIRTLPGTMCWRNPERNVNETTLTDLASVMILYDDEAPINAMPNRPREPLTAIRVVSECGVCQSSTVLQRVVGDTIALTWQPVDGPYTIRIFQWPDGVVPVLEEVVNQPSFDWVPAKAGIYFSEVEGETLVTNAQTHLFYIKLPTPTNGGID